MNLDRLRIASPCSATWDRMSGNDRVRFCDQCRKNVYNLSSMTREEAERLIAAKEGKLCAMFYRRKDGTVLTKDCPVGRAGWRKRMALRAACLVAIFLAPFISFFRSSSWVMGKMAVPPQAAHVRMGKIAVTRQDSADAADTKDENRLIALGGLADVDY